MLPTETEALRPRLSTVSFGSFTFDRDSRLLRSGEQEVSLPPRVLAVLDLLVARAGDIVPRQELIDSVWKDAFVTDTSLAEAISFLRQSLGDDPQAPTYVQTVHRRGYRFVAPVVEAVPAPPAPEAAPPAGVKGIAPVQVSPSIGRELVPWSVATLCAILAAAALWQYTHVRAPLPPVVRMPVEPSPGTAFDTRAPALALSPDGTVVAWSACGAGCSLYVRGIDQLAARAIPGTDDASAPFFSPDGRWIGFFAGGTLRKVALAGGLPMALTDAAQPFGAVWMPDERIVFAASARGGLLRVSDRGGEAEPLTQPSVEKGEIGHVWPSLAPGGRALLFIVTTSPLDSAPGRLAVMDAARTSPAWQTIIDGADLARAASPDYIAFLRGNELHAVAFDPTRLALAGLDQAVATGVARRQFGTSASGSLIYAASDTAPPVMTWMPLSAPADLAPELSALQGARLSPDGARIAGVRQDQGSADVWVGDVRRGAMTRLAHGGINVAPVWGEGPSGPVLFYAASSGGPFRLRMRDASAAGPETEVATTPGHSRRHVFPTSFARVPPGGRLAYTASGDGMRGDIFVVRTPDAASVINVATPFDETNGMLSPDGRLLAYQSDESGRWEIYLMRIADRRRTSVSTAGGTDPSWSADGRTLLYRTADRLVGVAIDATGDRIGAPVDLMPARGPALVGLAPSGLILVRRDAEQTPRSAILTLQWIRELRSVLGPPNAPLPR